MEPEDAQESCRSNNIDTDTLQRSAEDAFDKESVSIAVENLIHKLMKENRSLRKELASLKEVKAVNTEDYTDVKEKVNARQCTTSKGFEITGRSNTESKCDVNFLQKSMIEKYSFADGENADHIKTRKTNDSTGDRETLRINCISLNSGMKNADQNSRKSCRYCDEIHKWGSKYCTAYGRVCRKCGKQNHIAKVCRSSKRRAMTYFPEVNVTFLSNRIGEAVKMVIYKQDYKEYAIFPCSRNPTAKEVKERLRDVTYLHKLPLKVQLACRTDHGERRCKHLAEELRQEIMYIDVKKDPCLNVKNIIFSKEWRKVNINQKFYRNECRQMSCESRAGYEAITIGKENKVQLDKIKKQIRNIEMRIFITENI